MMAKNSWVFGLLVLAALLFAGWTGYGQRPTASRPAWEYKMISSGAKDFFGEPTLNELGTQGWELIAVAATETNGYTYYLKRPKQP